MGRHSLGMAKVRGFALLSALASLWLAAAGGRLAQADVATARDRLTAGDYAGALTLLQKPSAANAKPRKLHGPRPVH